MPYEERPPSKRARIAWLIFGWVLFIGPFTALFFFWAGWWGFITLGPALWFTYDYLKRGDMFSRADAMMSGEGRILGAWAKNRSEHDPR